MKINIITIHNIHNFGSVYQAYALYEYIRTLGHEVEIINYNPEYFRKMSLKSYIGKLSSPLNYLKKYTKFSKFIEQKMQLTIRYNSFDELEKNPPKADLYISGGDQLWNTHYPCGNDIAYKLSFVKGRKIAFGTSLGRDNYSNSELIKLMNNIADYELIALREKSTVKMLQDLNVSNVFNVVDPVALLPINRYLTGDQLNEFGNYLFVYLVEESELLDKVVTYISNKYKLKVVLCSGFKRKCKCDYFVRDKGPEDVVRFINNATFVLSASYHATLFSIMFGKDFSVLLPGENTNARILDLLSLMNLKDRIITENSCLDDIRLNSIDFDNQHVKLNSMIEYSKNLLDNYLNKLV